MFGFTIVTASLDYGRFIGGSLTGVTLEHLVMDGDPTDDSAEVVGRFPRASFLPGARSPDERRGQQELPQTREHRAMWLNAAERQKPDALPAMRALAEPGPAATANFAGSPFPRWNSVGIFPRRV